MAGMPVSFPYTSGMNFNAKFEILEVQLDTDGPYRFGRVTGGFLRFQGQTVEVSSPFGTVDQIDKLPVTSAYLIELQNNDIFPTT